MSTGTDELNERDRSILSFEKTWWKHPGAKEDAIRRQFDMSPTRYYQILNVLMDRPEAEVHEPMLIKRLRRLRAARASGRGRRGPGVASQG